MIVRLIVLLSVLLGVSPAFAQDDSWTATLFDHRSGRLTTIGPSGIIQDITLPGYDDYESAAACALSPDGSLLAMDTNTFTLTADQVHLVNMTSETQIATLPPYPDGMQESWECRFSPDGEQLALALTDRRAGAGMVAIYDVTTDAPTVVATLDMSRLDRTDFAAETVRFDAWDDRGLVVAPWCLPCEIRPDLIYQVWDPVNDTLTAGPLRKPSPQTTLPNGEEAWALSDIDIPGFNMAGDNALRFAPSGADEGVTIYWEDPGRLNAASWGLDGAAFFAAHRQEDATGMILFRDGTALEVELPTETYLLMGGTPDGWLMLGSYYDEERDALPVIHMTVDADGTVAFDELMVGTAWTWYVRLPDLSPEAEGFAPMPYDGPPPPPPF